MRNSRALIAGLIALLWCAAPAHAVTPTLVASGSCSTSTASCTITATANVATGSFVVVVGTYATSNNGTISVTDSAANCTTYVTVAKASSTNGTPFAAVCAFAGTALTSGTGTFTATTSAGSSYWAMQAYTVTGLASFDKSGTAVSGTWTTATATSFAATLPLGYTSEWALGIVSVGNGAVTDSLGSYSGGFASIGSLTAAARPELFLSSQTLTSGTTTIGATPTSAASRAFNSVTLLFATNGSTQCGNAGAMLLLGIGGGGACPASIGSQLDFSNPLNSGLMIAL